MEWFWAVLGVLLAGAVISLLVKQAGQLWLAPILGLGVGALVLLRLAPMLGEVLAVFANLAEQSGLGREYMAVLLKILAASYVAEFGAALCRDAGEGAFAAKVELAGRVCVAVLALPVVVDMLTLVLEILP